LVLFFRKEQESSFSEEKEAKRLYFRRVVFSDTGLGRKVIANQHLQGLARGEQLRENTSILGAAQREAPGDMPANSPLACAARAVPRAMPSLVRAFN
jgi:hypothetical protein